MSQWQVVIMRPQHQAQNLADEIQLFAKPILFSTLEIVPLAVCASTLQSWCDVLSHTEILIVTSANAIGCAPSELLTALRAKTHIDILTLGEATRLALQANQINHSAYAAPNSTSETLLLHPKLQQAYLQGKQVAILAGEGGRTLLAQTLSARGAKVALMHVYQQHKPQQYMAPMLAQWSLQGPLCFVATSLSCLQNAKEMAGEALDLFQSFPVVVVSERIAHIAKEWGFKHIFISQGANAKAICVALQELIKVCDTMPSRAL